VSRAQHLASVAAAAAVVVAVGAPVAPPPLPLWAAKPQVLTVVAVAVVVAGYYLVSLFVARSAFPGQKGPPPVRAQVQPSSDVQRRTKETEKRGKKKGKK